MPENCESDEDDQGRNEAVFSNVLPAILFSKRDRNHSKNFHLFSFEF